MQRPYGDPTLYAEMPGANDGPTMGASDMGGQHDAEAGQSSGVMHGVHERVAALMGPALVGATTLGSQAQEQAGRLMDTAHQTLHKHYGSPENAAHAMKIALLGGLATIGTAAAYRWLHKRGEATSS